MVGIAAHHELVRLAASELAARQHAPAAGGQVEQVGAAVCVEQHAALATSGAVFVASDEPQHLVPGRPLVLGGEQQQSRALHGDAHLWRHGLTTGTQDLVVQRHEPFRRRDFDQQLDRAGRHVLEPELTLHIGVAAVGPQPGLGEAGAKGALLARAAANVGHARTERS